MEIFSNKIAAGSGLCRIKDCLCECDYLSRGIRRLNQGSEVKIVTGMIDLKLNENKYIVPGLGDYSRFFGTC